MNGPGVNEHADHGGTRDEYGSGDRRTKRAAKRRSSRWADGANAHGRGNEVGQLAQHAFDAILLVVELDQIIGGNPTPVEPTAKLLKRLNIEAVGCEHVRRSLQHFGCPRNHGLKCQAVAGDAAQIVDAALVTGTAREPVIEEQLQPQQKVCRKSAFCRPRTPIAGL